MPEAVGKYRKKRFSISDFGIWIYLFLTGTPLLSFFCASLTNCTVVSDNLESKYCTYYKLTHKDVCALKKVWGYRLDTYAKFYSHLSLWKVLISCAKNIILFISRKAFLSEIVHLLHIKTKIWAQCMQKLDRKKRSEILLTSASEKYPSASLTTSFSSSVETFPCETWCTATWITSFIHALYFSIFIYWLKK